MADPRKHHLLLDARAGWRDARLDNATLGSDRCALRLAPLPGSGRPLVDEAGTFGGLALPTGLAVDDSDRIYILDAGTHLIKRYDPCQERFEPLPCVGGAGSAPRQLQSPHGIAISSTGDLYVADSGNHRVQIFSLKGLALRAIWEPVASFEEQGTFHVKPVVPTWQATDCGRVAVFPERTWEPWDVALACDCTTYVSDRAGNLIHVFNARGCWVRAWTVDRPTDMALDRHGNLYVVSEGKAAVGVYDASGKLLTRVTRPDDVAGEFCPIAVTVDSHGTIFISDRATRRLYMYRPGEEDGCPTSPQDIVCPALAFDNTGRLLLADAEKHCVLMTESKTAYALEGRYHSKALDSLIYQCLWHRVVMRAAIPFGTQVRVDTFTSESEKSDEEILSLPESRWSTAQLNAQTGEGEWDCLILAQPGRYLWFRLTLTSDGDATPAIEWVQVHYPRISSLEYLPATYSEDATGRDFLSRFLSITDTLRDRTADLIGTFARYLDPAAAPIEFLPWLASWLDLSLDRHWPESRRRQLVRQAHRLYRSRGTPEGVRLHVELYTGSRPRILEHFRLRQWLFVNHGRLGQSTVFGKAIMSRLQLDVNSRIGDFQLIDSGDPLRDPFHAYAHQFTVFVPMRKAATELERQTIARIVEMAKPAHTLAFLQMTEPRFRIGRQAFIGVDTVVSRYPSGVMAGQQKLGYDAVLGPSEDEARRPRMRIGVRTRIGSSTLID